MTEKGEDRVGFELEALPPEQHVALAWWQEENARRFYQQASELVPDASLQQLFVELAGDEVAHKSTLLQLYEGLTKQQPARDFPAGILPAGGEFDRIEGDVRLADALATVRSGDWRAACDMALDIERAALDRYLHLQHTLPDENARRVFEVLVIEERRHLKKLGAALENLPKPARLGS